MSASDMQFRTQIDMQIEPSNPTNVVTLGHLDAEVSNVVRFDGDRNVTFPAGMKVRVSIPATEDREEIIKDVLATDASGNILIGEDDEQVNIVAMQRPTITNGSGIPDTIVITGDLEPYALDADVVNLLAYKADLVSGVVPDVQLPDNVKVNNWTVATAADLITLTAATVNDRAFVGTADPYDTYYLVALPPTNSANWRQAGGGGGGTAGVVSVNGLTGPAVTIDLANFPNVQNALDDKANSSDLALYAPLNSPALTGSPTAPNPPANATGQQIMTAAAVNTKMANYLPLTGGTINGYISSITPSGEYGLVGFATSEYSGNLTKGSIIFGTSSGVLYFKSLTGTFNFSNGDNSLTTRLISGDIPLNLSDNTLATAKFVKGVVAGYLPLSGGTLTGSLNTAGTVNMNPSGTSATLNMGPTTGDRTYIALNTNGTLDVAISAGVVRFRSPTRILATIDNTGLSVTGTITTPTRPAGTNDTTVATTEFVNTKAAGYLPLSGGTMTGDVRVTGIRHPDGGYLVKQDSASNALIIQTQGTNQGIQMRGSDSALSRVYAATAPAGTNDPQVATTAFVQSAINAIPTPQTLRRTTGTLTTAGWSGTVAPWTQTVTMSNTQTGNIGPAVPCTVAQFNEYRNCGLVVTARTDTTITWSAADKKPTIAIPVEYVGA